MKCNILDSSEDYLRTVLTIIYQCPEGLPFSTNDKQINNRVVNAAVP